MPPESEGLGEVPRDSFCDLLPRRFSQEWQLGQANLWRKLRGIWATLSLILERCGLEDSFCYFNYHVLIHLYSVNVCLNSIGSGRYQEPLSGLHSCWRSEPLFLIPISFRISSTAYTCVRLVQWTEKAIFAVDCIDCAADESVVSAVHEGIEAARGILPVRKPWVMISVNDDEDLHFRKAGSLICFLGFQAEVHKRINQMLTPVLPVLNLCDRVWSWGMPSWLFETLWVCLSCKCNTTAERKISSSTLIW